MAWKGYAPTNKEKVIKTFDVQRNDSVSNIHVEQVSASTEKGKEKNELISKHKIIKKINRKLSIFCSPGHFIGFNNLNKKEETKLKNFLFKHQIKKKFQCSLEWEKNQLAIWDNRSMLHQATPFRGNRIMHRITIY